MKHTKMKKVKGTKYNKLVDDYNQLYAFWEELLADYKELMADYKEHMNLTEQLIDEVSKRLETEDKKKKEFENGQA